MMQYNPYQRYATRTVVTDQNAIGDVLSKALSQARKKKQPKQKQPKPPKMQMILAPKFKPAV